MKAFKRIYDEVEVILAVKGGGEKYYHVFRTKVEACGCDDGSVLLRSPHGVWLWGDYPATLEEVVEILREELTPQGNLN